MSVSTPGRGARPNPCLSCGACCARFRCSFHWSEADDATPGGVPVALTENLTVHRRAMRGTNAEQPRCVALAGTIGQQVRCTIHTRRPTTCRDFPASYSDGAPNERCDAARAAIGLPPLTPADWECPADEPPKPTRPVRPAA